MIWVSPTIFRNTVTTTIIIDQRLADQHAPRVGHNDRLNDQLSVISNGDVTFPHPHSLPQTQ